ncbi:hypothetical protein D3C72_1687410 [compost metagenome]
MNFEVGIILPRGTPARSGVMHSMSSMPRALSQAAASFQVLTPRVELMSGGMLAFFDAAPLGLSIFFFGGMSHRFGC